MPRIKSEEEILERQQKIAAGKEPAEDEPAEEEEPAPEEPNVDPRIEELESELAKTRQQMSALQGRLTPAQQQSEEYRRLYQTEQEQHEEERQKLNEQINALNEKLNSVTAESRVEDLLTEDEREYFDPEQLKVMTKVADAIAKSRMPKTDVRNETLKVLQEREENQIQQYREEVLSDPQRGLADLSTLANDPSFQEWLTQEENDDFDPLVNSFLNARSTKEIDRLGRAIGRRVAKYKEGKRKPKNKKEADPGSPSAAGGLQRRPQEPGKEEMNNKLAEAKRLSRSRKPEDQKKAKEILDSLT